jgi:FixJ family two-component response regulator
MSHVSVIDDDESVRAATVDLLNSVGLACDAFESAQAYLESGRAHSTSCLVLDVSMPGMNGLELQQRLVEAGHAIPIIFITAFPTAAVRARALRSGAVCFLPKPYADEELVRCVGSALGRTTRPNDEGGRCS